MHLILFATLLPNVAWAEGESDPLWKRHNYEKKVSEIGNQLRMANHIKQLIGFHVMNQKIINASASDRTGNVYIDLALLRYIQSDDELAAILSHEMGHIIKRHVAKGTMRRMAGATVATGALYAVDSLLFLGAPVFSGAYLANTVTGGAANVMTRNQEIEADLLGVQYMVNAGYNPAAMLSVFEKVAGDAGNPWSSHPLSTRRMARVQALIRTKYPDVWAKMESDWALAEEQAIEKLETRRKKLVVPATETAESKDVSGKKKLNIYKKDAADKDSTEELVDSFEIDPDNPETAVMALREIMAKQQQELNRLREAHEAQKRESTKVTAPVAAPAIAEPVIAAPASSQAAQNASNSGSGDEGTTEPVLLPAAGTVKD
ncbi:MAG: M48 family metallopeptidase [Vampirovibrionales bacterium]|nr:M48 family metallopeptidase [Vampirovibrionales bacterium]